MKIKFILSSHSLGKVFKFGKAPIYWSSKTKS